MIRCYGNHFLRGVLRGVQRTSFRRFNNSNFLRNSSTSPNFIDSSAIDVANSSPNPLDFSNTVIITNNTVKVIVLSSHLQASLTEKIFLMLSMQLLIRGLRRCKLKLITINYIYAFQLKVVVVQGLSITLPWKILHQG